MFDIKFLETLDLDFKPSNISVDCFVCWNFFWCWNFVLFFQSKSETLDLGFQGSNSWYLVVSWKNLTFINYYLFISHQDLASKWLNSRPPPGLRFLKIKSIFFEVYDLISFFTCWFDSACKIFWSYSVYYPLYIVESSCVQILPRPGNKILMQS